jgi:hypothetical protein
MDAHIAYKFLLNDNGVLFLVADDIEKSKQDLELVLAEENFYLKIGDIFNLLSDAIIDHIRLLVEKYEEVNFAWYQSAADDYEMKFMFAKSLSRGDCSKLVVMHDLKRKGLLGQRSSTGMAH